MNRSPLLARYARFGLCCGCPPPSARAVSLVELAPRSRASGPDRAPLRPRSLKLRRALVAVASRARSDIIRPAFSCSLAPAPGQQPTTIA